MSKIFYVTLVSLLGIAACTPTTMKIIDDVIEGESKTLEKVVNDEMGATIQQRPQVTLVEW